ncbi:MAG: hypothetical protein IJU16_03280 [Clostridia bacterium]|nr:hypothetical protein [Clostridia bacterium]
MKFPNAAKGIKKIYNAEILNLIAILLTGLVLILTVVLAGSVSAESEVGAGLSGVGVLVCAAAVGVLAIISLILMIIGTIQAAKDESSFRMIIFLTILNMIIACLAACFSGNQFINSLSTSFNAVVSLISSVLVVIGVSNLARGVHNGELEAKCASILKIIICIGLLSLVARFFAVFMLNAVAMAFVIALVVVSMILSVVQYILYLSMLKKAKNVLAEN